MEIITTKYFILKFLSEPTFHFGLIGLAYNKQEELFMIEIIFIIWSLQFYFGNMKNFEI